MSRSEMADSPTLTSKGEPVCESINGADTLYCIIVH